MFCKSQTRGVRDLHLGQPIHPQLSSLLEGIVRVEQPRIDKVDHCMKLGQLVLDRSTREDDPALHVEAVQGLRGFRACRLEAVPFVADDEADGRLDILELVDDCAQLERRAS